MIDGCDCNATQGSVDAEVPGTTESGGEEAKRTEESPEYRENLIRVVRAAEIQKQGFRPPQPI